MNDDPVVRPFRKNICDKKPHAWSLQWDNQKKFALSENDDEWIIQDDNIHTFAHGHFGAHRWDIKRMWIFFTGQTMKNFSGLLKSRLTSKCSRTALWNRPWFQVNFREVNLFKVNLKIKVDSKMCQKPHFIITFYYKFLIKL